MAKGTPPNGVKFTELYANGVMGPPHSFIAKTAPTVAEGLQWLSGENRLHYSSPGDRLHFMSGENRLHWSCT